MTEPLDSGRDYHARTSHVRNRIPPHHLDFSRYPRPFKSYDYGAKLPFSPRAGDAGAGIGRVMENRSPGTPAALDIGNLSRALLLAYGVTLEDRKRGVLFRSVPSAGGLYPCQLYLSVLEADGLETGLYYCDTVRGFFGRLSPRPLSPALIPARTAQAAASLILTGIFYHSAWKYRERAFRYLLLDGGHLAEAVINSFHALSVPAKRHYDFNDSRLIRDLNLDPSLEVPLACISLGPDTERAPAETEPSQMAESRPDPTEPVRYEMLARAHALGTSVKPRPDPADVPDVFQDPPESVHKLSGAGHSGSFPFTEAVVHRRSRRNFVPDPMPADQWGTLLSRVFRGRRFGHDPAETGDLAWQFLNLGMIAQNLEGLTDGLYSFAGDGKRIECRQKGSYSQSLSRICLDQAWIGAAAINFLCMADLTHLESRLGTRGYRYVMLEAGRIGQRLYLTAEELGLGCCGIGAMYDREAAGMLGLTRDSVLLYALSVGPVHKRIHT